MVDHRPKESLGEPEDGYRELRGGMSDSKSVDPEGNRGEPQCTVLQPFEECPPCSLHQANDVCGLLGTATQNQSRLGFVEKGPQQWMKEQQEDSRG